MPKINNKKLNCFEIKNLTDDSADLLIYGDIVSDSWMKWSNEDTCPQDITDFLNNLDGKSKINVYINSGGGSVFAGLAIYNMLKRHKAEKTVYIDGLAGSIASVIAMAGDKVIIPKSAFLMVHKPWSSVWGGDANEFRKMADTLDRLEEGIINVYEDNMREGVTREEIQSLVEEETWLNGAEAEKYFNVEVDTSSENVAACVSDCFKNYKNVPDFIKNKQKSTENEPKDDYKHSLNAKRRRLDLKLLEV